MNDFCQQGVVDSVALLIDVNYYLQCIPIFRIQQLALAGITNMDFRSTYDCTIIGNNRHCMLH